MDEPATVELIQDESRRDTHGRRLDTPQERARLLAAYDHSGLTQRAFARREGINYNTLVWWLKQRRDKQRQGSTPTFEEFRLSTPENSPLEAQLPDGTCIRGNNPEALAQLLKALRP